jgi:hypothetical protein
MITYSVYDNQGHNVAGGSCSSDSIDSIVASYQRQGYLVSFGG